MPRQNTSPADYPQAVLQQIEQLAQNIVIARKRRGESQAQWAKKLGISQPTMARIERGDPSVAMASYVMCMWLINPAIGLAALVAPQNDHGALEKELAKVKRRRPPKPAPAGIAAGPPTAARRAPAGRGQTATYGDPSARPAVAAAVEVSDIARLGLDPQAEMRKYLAGQSKASGQAPAAAGLAALLSGSSAKKP